MFVCLFVYLSVVFVCVLFVCQLVVFDCLSACLFACMFVFVYLFTVASSHLLRGVPHKLAVRLFMFVCLLVYLCFCLVIEFSFYVLFANRPLNC